MDFSEESVQMLEIPSLCPNSFTSHYLVHIYALLDIDLGNGGNAPLNAVTAPTQPPAKICNELTKYKNKI